MVRSILSAGAGFAVVLGLTPGCGNRAPGSSFLVRVRAVGCGPVARVATGVTVGSNRVVTVAHTLRGATDIVVSGSSATLVAIDHRRDLAVLDTARLQPRPVPATFSHPVLGDAFLERLPVTGAALRYSPVSVANVGPIEIDEPRDSTRYRRDGFVAKLTDPADAVESGDSGSPIVDARGRVLGLVFATDRTEGRSAFATESGEIESLLRGVGHGAVPTGPCDL